MGWVVMGIHPQDKRLKLLKAKKFPFVAYGRSDVELKYPYVDVDGAAGISEAVLYLASLGHERIAYLTPPDSLMCAGQRWEGFEKGMEAAGLEIRKEYRIKSEFSEDSGFNGTNTLLNLPEPPTAILTSNDICAFGALRALKNKRLIPGKEISIIGFDDIALAGHWQPGLTTISQPFRKIGFLLMQSLFSILTNENTIPQTVLEAQLVIVDRPPAPCLRN